MLNCEGQGWVLYILLVICHISTNSITFLMLNWRGQQWVIFVCSIICHINTNIIKLFIADMERTKMFFFRIFEYLPYKY
jgi:hypothetical protein